MTEGLWGTAGLPSGLAEELAARHELPVRVARWLCLRHKVTDKQVQEWKNPSAEPLSPWLFHHMQTAVQRLQDALARRERICIVGDYDVDGVTASAILATTLQRLDADWFCLIPHRIHDGYGLSESLVDRAVEQGARLIVTVDNGIAATAAIQRAQQVAVEVIITDHHEPLEHLPEGVCAVVHWRLADSREVTQLSGAGVAWKLASALLERVLPNEDTEDLLNWHMGLATLGALADVMPMESENRALVYRGLKGLRQSRHPGWQALCEVAGIERARITDRTLLWNITPRINAAGRMGTAELALQLLLAKDLEAARGLANQLEHYNDLRKRETARALDEAIGMCEQEFGSWLPAALAIAGPWPLGVVGIVAAKLSELYERPVIVFADDGSTVLRGSGRAPEGFGLHDAVSRCAEHLVHFGGHEAAVGCAVDRSHVQPFAAAFARSAGSTEPPLATRAPIPLADDYLPLAEATLEMVDWLDRFAPFGPGNPEFHFYVGPVQLMAVTSMGQGNHLRLRVQEGKASVDLVWFQAPKNAAEWPVNSWIAAVVVLERNDWRGTSRVQLRVQQAFLLRGLVSRDDLGYLYRLLRARRRLKPQDGAVALSAGTDETTKMAFDTFVELGFAEWDMSAYHVVEQVAPRDLRDSLNYQRHLREAMNVNLSS